MREKRVGVGIAQRMKVGTIFIQHLNREPAPFILAKVELFIPHWIQTVFDDLSVQCLSSSEVIECCNFKVGVTDTLTVPILQILSTSSEYAQRSPCVLTLCSTIITWTLASPSLWRASTSIVAIMAFPCQSGREGQESVALFVVTVGMIMAPRVYGEGLHICQLHVTSIWICTTSIVPDTNLYVLSGIAATKFQDLIKGSYRIVCTIDVGSLLGDGVSFIIICCHHDISIGHPLQINFSLIYVYREIARDTTPRTVIEPVQLGDIKLADSRNVANVWLSLSSVFSSIDDSHCV